MAYCFYNGFRCIHQYYHYACVGAPCKFLLNPLHQTGNLGARVENYLSLNGYRKVVYHNTYPAVKNCTKRVKTRITATFSIQKRLNNKLQNLTSRFNHQFNHHVAIIHSCGTMCNLSVSFNPVCSFGMHDSGLPVWISRNNCRTEAP